MGGGSQLEHVGVITSRETSVARHHDEQTVLYFALLRETVEKSVLAEAISHMDLYSSLK